MSLDQKSFLDKPSETTLPTENVIHGSRRGFRQAGILLALVGVSLISLTVGVALAGATTGGDGDEVLGGSEAGEVVSGGGGDDDLYGFSGDDGLSGGRGNDRVYGGAGRDVLIGGAGNDFIEARDGQEDYVDCGEGSKDVAGIDAEDRVSPGCEFLYRP